MHRLFISASGRQTGLTLLTVLLSALVFLNLTGCEALENKPFAVGPEGEIIIVIDSTNWNGPLGEAIRTYVSPYLGTLPAPEKEFTLRQVSIVSKKVLDGLQKQKNVIFVAPLMDDTPEASFLKSRLAEEAALEIQNGGTTVISRRDLWRSSQQIVYLLGQTPESLIKLLTERSEDIRYAFNVITRERVTLEMFKKGRQPKIEAALMKKHTFAVAAQHDYFVAIDTTDFVWLRRTVNSESWRSMFIYYVDGFNPANLTPEWIYEARERLTETYIRGNLDGYVSIDFRRELNTENIDFLSHFAFETRGLWQMVGKESDGKVVEYGMGGPFLNYTFYDESSGRLYMIDGMVFAPGYDKREFLRQMEVIAHTFRTTLLESELEVPSS
ncbi:MAG: DUF4837 family protein [Bacteroidetes bacterium]|nr:DUF4837 family protein [Bacteroidota bacterium]